MFDVALACRADFKANGSSEATVRAAGKLRMEGRGYEVQDGDIIHVSLGAPVVCAPVQESLVLYCKSICLQFKFGQAAK